MTDKSTHTFTRQGAVLAVVGLLAIGSSGCATKYKDLKVFVQAHRHDVAATSYCLEPPDVIRIDSPTSPEVNQETQRIRSDGKISLRLIGDVQVSGLTPEQVAAKLEELLSRYYESPKVTVRVAAFESKNVYAFGQVMARGPQPFTGRDTLLDVVAHAQPNFLAWGAQVKVIRPSPSADERHEIVVNVDKILESGDTSKNFLLQEGDIVFVPPTPLGWVGLRIQELLFPISPALSTYNAPAQVQSTTNQLRSNGGYDQESSGNNMGGTRQLLMLLK
jgi:polysaccharide biosynthesis/export protein